MLNYWIQRAILRNQGISSTSVDSIKQMESDSSFASCASVSYKDYRAEEEVAKSYKVDPGLSGDTTGKSPTKNASWNELLSNLDGKSDSTQDFKKDKTWSELLSNIEPGNNPNDGNFGVSNSDVMSGMISSDGESDEDEFFEAHEDITEASSTTEITQPEDEIDFNDADREPDGVKHETKMKLLRTGKPLCVPITQVRFHYISI